MGTDGRARFKIPGYFDPVSHHICKAMRPSTWICLQDSVTIALICLLLLQVGVGFLYFINIYTFSLSWEACSLELHDCCTVQSHSNHAFISTEQNRCVTAV